MGTASDMSSLAYVSSDVWSVITHIARHVCNGPPQNDQSAATKQTVRDDFYHKRSNHPKLRRFVTLRNSGLIRILNTTTIAIIIITITTTTGGTPVAQWLRCCATNRRVTGSIPAGVSGFFIDIKYF